MLHPPKFWLPGRGGFIGSLLEPVACLTKSITARRLARPGWRAPVPVICCGNATVGGAGKTTVALDLGQRLVRSGEAVHFILRGYGGASKGCRRVDPSDPVTQTGDEALLLASIAPTWTGGNRAESARAAVAAGATVLVMDDGLQNPTLQKDLSLLIVDARYGFGNGRVLPAGPLREPVAAAAARCDAAVLIGEGTPAIPAGLPVLRAKLLPDRVAGDLHGRRVVAFAGIGVPDKFFATVRGTGADVVAQIPFPDHHPYAPHELDALLKQSEQLGAIPVTTAKDLMRIPLARKAAFTVVSVTLAWDDEAAVDALIARAVPGFRTAAFPGRATSGPR